MTYIVTALKPEAQAFVDKYKLSKNKLGDFTLFKNKNMHIIVSGIGSLNAKKATEKLIETFKKNDDDIYLNIGICGGYKNYSIGELVEVGAIIYNNETFVLNKNTTTKINCLNNEMSQNIHKLVDMESFGFYEATINKNNVYMYKVVSDHFEPNKVTKEGTKSLIFNVIEEVMQKVKHA